MFEEMIESYLARLKEIEGYDVKSVILFSSVARGQAKENSDIDIIVVAAGLPELRNKCSSILPQASPNSGYLDDAGGAGGYGNSQDGIPGGCAPGGASAAG